ncbi:MAG: WYL domain-containing protein, partial [Bergeyella zoohelcum]|nr:WYL domain-containing protein [Bergeyella zoohelcum]
MKRDVLKRRVWLIDTIAQNDGISLKHLQEKWLKSEVNDQKTPLNERTFHRDKDDILIIFGIEIKCERNAYFIKNKEEFKGNSFINWLMNSFTISNLLQEWKSMRERILLEEIPSSREFLIPIITAMDRSVQIEFVYQRFQEAEEKSYRLS